MSAVPPKEGWYFKKVATDEKLWIALALVVCLSLFAWMVLWHVYGKQNPSSTTYKTTPKEFSELANAFIEKNKIGEENGIPIVKPAPNTDVFLVASMWRWEPILVLKKGQEYRFHLSSLDLTHGFSLQPVNMNYIVYPGYDYVLTFKPTSSGDFRVFCNEFCGIGHHTMIGKIVVED